MSVIQAVLQFLERNSVSYSVNRQIGNSYCPYRVATVLLADAQGTVILAYPESQGIDLGAVRRITHRKLEFAGRTAYKTLVGDAPAQYLPPLGGMWGVPTLVEKTLFSWPYLEFPLDSKNFVRIEQKNYRGIFPGKRGFEFSHAAGEVEEDINAPVDDEKVRELLEQVAVKGQKKRILDATEVAERFKDSKALPVMPGMVHHILRLMGNPEANVTDLVELIEQDQALSANLIRLARSPFYATETKVNNVYDAVYRVVGYDGALRITLAMIFSRFLQGPLEGRVGIKSIWEEALSVAITARYIAMMTSLGQLIRPGVMYAAALLHNIGYLALSHLFPREYSVFNQLATSMKDTPLRELERSLLDVTPLDFSQTLLEHWKMPEEIIEVANYVATQKMSEISSGYVDCMCLAQEYVHNKGFEYLSGAAKKVITNYGINGVELEENLLRDDVAAEVPFLSELMLG